MDPFQLPLPGTLTVSRQEGVLPAQMLRDYVVRAHIRGNQQPIEVDQIQPASIDLRLGSKAYRVRASFLPGRKSRVQDKLKSLSLYELDLTKSAVLEKNCTFIIPLQEDLYLPLSVHDGRTVSGVSTPKSSTGRLDIFTRLITDFGTEFERVPEGYRGPLYIEVCPRTFSVVARTGDRLNQLRLRIGNPQGADSWSETLHERYSPVFAEGPGIGRGLWITVSLYEGDPRRPIAFRARRHAPLLDLSRVNYFDPINFWEPIYSNDTGTLILNPDDFYILRSKDEVWVPPTQTAEMVPYDTTAGEFRAHYAGFFDPGFGWYGGAGTGTCAVLEVRSHEVPFLLEDGQKIGRLVYEDLLAEPDRLYGSDIGSHYWQQGLTLSKHFRPYEADAGLASTS